MMGRRMGLWLLLLALVIAGAAWARTHTQPQAEPAVLRTVPLRGQPLNIAVDPRTGRAFVAAQDTRTLTGGGSVGVVDTRTGRLLTTITVGTNPQVVAVDEQTSRAFVLDAGYGGVRYTVSVLDTRGDTLLRTVPLTGGRPDAVALDGRTGHVFVVNAGLVGRLGAATGLGSVTMLDARSASVVRTTRVGSNPTSIAADELTGRVFVVNSGATIASPGSVSVLDATTGAVLTTVSAGRGAGVVMVDEGTGRAFVAGGNAVRVLDARTGRVLRITPAGDGPLAVDAHTGHILIVDRWSGTMSILDGHDGHVLRAVPQAVPIGTGDVPIGIAVNPRSGLLFVAIDRANGGRVSILDARTGGRRRTLVVDSDPAAIAMDARAGHAIVGFVGDGPLSDARPQVAVPAWLRWLPFLPQPVPPRVPGSVSLLDGAR